MKLTEKALQQIDNKTIRAKLALALDFTERWIIKCIKENKANGPLTTIAALRLIKRETGLKESEILEDSAAQWAA